MKKMIAPLLLAVGIPVVALAESLYMNEGEQTLAASADLEHIVVSNGTLNVTGVGTVVTAADVSVGIGAGALGTLNITDGAQLVVTGVWVRAQNYHPVNVGHGGTGVVNVVNAQLTAHDLLLSNLQSPFYSGGVGYLTASNATVTVQDYLHNTRGNNSNLTSPLSVITLREGGLLDVSSYAKNANPWAAIRFEGGRMLYTKLDAMDGSRLILEGVNGHPIDLQPRGANQGQSLYLFHETSSNNGGSEIYLRGNGGFVKRGTMSGYVAYTSGTHAGSSFVRGEFSGPVRLEGGALVQTGHNQLGGPAATLDFSNSSYARFDMKGYDLTLGSVVGRGLENSGTDAALLTLGGDGANSELDEVIGRVALLKEGAGTLTLRGTPLSDVTVAGGRVIVAEGAWPAYSSYRVEFEAVAGSKAAYLGLSEIGFFHPNGDRDLNTRASARSPSGAFDDNWEVQENTSNCSLWELDKNPWPIRATITHSYARTIAGYRICTGYDYGCQTHHEGRESIKGADYSIDSSLCRDPSAWKVYGSRDGSNWTLLDQQVGQVLPNRRYAWTETYPLPKMTLIAGAVRVKTGAALDVACEEVFAPTSVINQGVITLAAGTAYGVASAAGQAEQKPVYARISGRPAFRKTGEGSVTLRDGTAYSGSMTVADGTVKFTKATGYSQKYWRFRIRNLKAWKDGAAFTPNSIELQELGLFDLSGTRVNLTSGGTQVVTGLPSAPKILDGNVDQGLFQFIEASGLPANAVPIPRPFDEDPASWATVIVFKLPASAPPVCGYQMVTGYDHPDRDPNSWDLSVSDNGTDWTIVDVRTKVEIGEERKSWTAYNQGAFFELTDGEGEDYVVYTPDTVVSIAPQARLELPGDLTQTGVLEVDCVTGAGVLSHLNPAPNGELRLVGVSAPGMSFEVPLEIGHVVNAWNLRTWTIRVNGEISTRHRLVFSNGKLMLVSQGTSIIFR